MNSKELDKILSESLSKHSDVYIPSSKNEDKYINDLKSSILSSKCNPFLISAKIVEPGFPNKKLGEKLEGYCIAHNDGYWLVYQPEENIFYCFWGADLNTLGAHGIYGSPLYCWSA